MTNEEKYPEAWKFFVKYARNIGGGYRISKPDESGEFLYADDPGTLFEKFKKEFYKPLEQVRYIANNLNY